MKIVARAATACVLLAAAASAGHAQEAIDPDRPDVTNGTRIVDVGLWQVELGGIYARNSPRESAFGSPLTVRVGLTDWLEARFGTDGVLSVTDGENRTTGMGNFQVGAKLRLWADPGGAPVLSILPAVNLPTASADKGLGSGDADYASDSISCRCRRASQPAGAGTRTPRASGSRSRTLTVGR